MSNPLPIPPSAQISNGAGMLTPMWQAWFSQLLQYVNAGGGASGADPTAKVGLTAVDGSATTYLRSDGAPALDQSINPTWTGTHTFDNTIEVAGHDVVTGARSVNAGAGLSGGGALSADVTLALDLTHANTWTGEQTFSPTTGYGLTIEQPSSGSKGFAVNLSGGASLYGYADGGGSGITNADPYTGGSMVYLDGHTTEIYGDGVASVFGPGGTLEVAGYLVSDGGALYLTADAHLAVSDEGDGYLRLNNNSDFTNGIYTSGRLNVDNGYQFAGAAIMYAAGNLSLAYGSVGVSGGTNSYAGYAIYDGAASPTFMSNGTSFGVYAQHSGWNRWSWLDDGSSFTTPLSLVASGNISAYSDARHKTDLAVIDNPLDRIAQLTGYTYTRTDGNFAGQRQTGLLAQDVREVLPEAVTENSDGYLSLAYGNLAGLFVEGFKALTARIEALEAAHG